MTNYRRKKNLPKPVGKRFNVNSQVAGTEFRVINEEGGMVGILSRAELFALAEEKELDIVEINPKAEPPVVKVIDYHKFKYQLQKSESSKPAKGTETKTILVSVRISIHDLKVRVNKIHEFLERGDKVKLQVKMKAREKSHPEVAQETLKTFLSLIEDQYTFENNPELLGDSYIATIKPKK
jgi:translation initiation factor IF-3